MEHPELKPCPKCNSNHLAYCYRYNCTKTFFPKRWLIVCIDCDYMSHEDGGEITRKRAMEAHNRRADNEQRKAD